MKNCSQLFYQVMGYPEPTKEVMNFLVWSQATDKSLLNESFHYEPKLCDLYSREQEPSEIMSDYLSYIQKYSRIYRSIPFVSHIYLANSITFNALHDQSDIDLLIITKPGRMRIARFRSWLLFFVLGISRFGNRRVKKFCLSFYIDQKHQNLYPILLQPTDIYMIFWLSHLVPLYCEYAKDADDIRKHNKRIKGYLPNHPLKQTIRLGNELIIGSSGFKNALEKAGRGTLAQLGNWLVGIVRKPILLFKRARLGKKGWGIIISDGMLKFHRDKRKDINLRFISAMKKG